MNLKDIRTDYGILKLEEKDLEKTPFLQFSKWLKEAIEKKVEEVNAFTLATVNKENIPSARIVLMRDFSEKGLVFYTNYNSAKGNDFVQNSVACANFFWIEFQRQVRITGRVEKVSEEESDAYFASRPRGSQLGAWASAQSTKLESAEALQHILEEITVKYEGETVPRPPHWGGYRIVPSEFEFWQGRPSRLHDRLKYSLSETAWNITRVFP